MCFKMIQLGYSNDDKDFSYWMLSAFPEYEIKQIFSYVTYMNIFEGKNYLDENASLQRFTRNYR